jgi:hypothetical protein
LKTILTLVAAALAAATLASSASAGDSRAGIARGGSPSEPYVPFVTDFPAPAREAAPPRAAVRAAGGFDEVDAAFGAAAGLALSALAAASLRRRGRVSSA